MNIKPTKEALRIAKKNGTSILLNTLAGERGRIASRDGGSRTAGRHLNAEARKQCGIPAGVPLFEESK